MNDNGVKVTNTNIDQVRGFVSDVNKYCPATLVRCLQNKCTKPRGLLNADT